MNAILIELMGIVAGLICTSGFVFQLIKGYRTKKMNDVSFGMFFVLIVGMSIWVMYGYIIGAIAVMGMNAFAIILCIIILLFKEKYK